MMTSCEICVENVSKYRCSVCEIKYCSLDCYKRHKATQECVKHQVVQREQPAEPKPCVAPVRDYPREDVVPEKLLEYLKCSQHLRDLLANPHLRTLLKQLSQQRNPAKLLDQFMQEPIFVEFSDACMDVIDPQK